MGKGEFLILLKTACPKKYQHESQTSFTNDLVVIYLLGHIPSLWLYGLSLARLLCP